MEEQEPPIEAVHEEIDRHAERAGAEEGRGRWVMGVALSAAILAGLAAVASLLSGHHANEALLEQLRASDNWAFYQAKGIKAAVLSAKVELLAGLDKPVRGEDRQKLAEYQREQEEISREAKEQEGASRGHLARHVVYSRAVTFFQVAIAVAAISVLTRRRVFWFVGLAFGVAGVGFMGWAMGMG